MLALLIEYISGYIQRILISIALISVLEKVAAIMVDVPMLIEMVRARPALYHTKDKDYKNHELIEAEWKFITKEMGLPSGKFKLLQIGPKV